ncbi:F-box protein [Sporobolomyces salmoneus]|uniref:F-box protein n=1 Tax=Sporobolomyces salmoneus TaxID=183962 RepID=UPI00316C465A
MPHLPDELLLDIFELVPSQHDLARLSYSSKTCAAVVKPLLYSHIRIGNKKQCPKLRAINEEDAKLVRTVSILGDFAQVWNEDVEDLAKLFEDAAFMEEFEEEGGSEQGGKYQVLVCEVGAGTVQEFFEGKLFNPEYVTKVLARNIHERPFVELRNPAIIPCVLKNLRDLSISIHRGAARLWTAILRKRYLPSLRRRGIWDVTVYSIERRGGGGLTEVDAAKSVLEKTDLLDQLDILASYEYPVLRLYPQLVHLAIVAGETSLSHTTKYATVMGGGRFMVLNESVVRHLDLFIAQSGRTVSLEYVWVESCLARCQVSLQQILDAAVEKGVKVHYDGDRDEGLIPQNFVDFLEEKKKRKDAEEEK